MSLNDQPINSAVSHLSALPSFCPRSHVVRSRDRIVVALSQFPALHEASTIDLDGKTQDACYDQLPTKSTNTNKHKQEQPHTYITTSTNQSIVIAQQSTAATMMKLTISFVLCLLFLFALTNAMDHGKFQKCAQKSFCHRLRQSDADNNVPNKKSHYIIDSFTINDKKDEFTAKLIDPSSPSSPNGDLIMVINAHDSGIFRLRMREWTANGLSDKLNRRYQVQDVLMSHVTPVSFTHNSKGEEEVVLTLQSSSLIIFRGKANGPAFQLKLQVNGQDAFTINGDELLKVESQFVKEREDATWEQARIKQQEEEEQAKKKQEENKQEGDDTAATATTATTTTPLPPKYEGEYALGIDFTFHGAKNVYGIPERTTDLSLKATRGKGVEQSEPYRMYNLDVFEYELQNPLGLYGVIPLLYSLKKGLAAGVLVLNPSESFVDIEVRDDKDTHAHWISEFGMLDVFLLPGPTPMHIVNQYSYLTGYNALPQQFALAYHQCRWNYKDEDDVAMVDAKYDEMNIPMDVLWLDIEHTDQKKYFTWEKHLFPHPKQMLQKIEGKGRKMVTISDPHIKRSSGYYVHDEATKNGYYVKKKDGSDYEGDCWPGRSSWLDYFSPEVRKYYASLFRFDRYEGSHPNLYTWIDMNEPSVFSGPEVTMDKDAVHHGGLTHGEVHNLYGFYQGVATYQGHIERRSGEDRPFILSRSFFAGSQRYVAIWTGDNTAKWDHLDMAQPMIMAFGISGLSFVGADVGGFFGNPSGKLLARWYQAGAFYPFFRAHAHIETQRREPWLFGENTMNIIRSAIQRRYTLLPYYYTLAFHASVNAAPIMRPLFFDYPEDDKTYDMQDQFLIGSNLLVKPVVEEDMKSVAVYFPGGSDAVWYDYEDETKYSSGFFKVDTPETKIPVFQKGGSIIATKNRMRRASSLMEHDPFTLRIALDKNLKAYGDLYIDDGKSFAYKKGQYLYRTFSFDKNKLTTQRGDLTSVMWDKHSARDPPSKSYTVPNTVERLIIMGYPSKPSKITLQVHPTDTVNVASPDAIALQSSLEFQYNASTNTITVRKPMMRTDSQWTISIE